MKQMLKYIGIAFIVPCLVVSLVLYFNDLGNDTKGYLAASVGFLMILSFFIGYMVFNYQYDTKFHVHNINKKVIYTLFIIVNVLAIISEIVVYTKYCYILIICHFLVLGISYLTFINKYFIALLSLVIYPSTIFVKFDFNKNNFLIFLGVILVNMALAYKAKYQKVKINVSDNY